MKMNPFWLMDLTDSNVAALWAVGVLATACAVLLSRPLRRSPFCRSGVVGLAVMLFAAPVYSVTFDPSWAAPWPSACITAAIAVGEFEAAWGFFQDQFWLPPFAWGILAAFLWHECSNPFAQDRSNAFGSRPAGGPPIA